MSGIEVDGRSIRKGSVDAISDYLIEHGSKLPDLVRESVDAISRSGGTPLVVAENGRALGVIHLKDVVKGGMKERFDQLRAMGIRTIMITGDNPLTAAAIAREAGVDDFLAEAKPKDKMDLIKREQAEGKLVAMTGDGTNDAPALAQADVGVAMNSGTQAAKEAGNMVDLDSNPTKLIEIVAIGKQLLMTRGALTTFSISNDIAKYFAIIPAMFAGAFPVLNALNIMHLHNPESAILSAVIFNALIIVALIPLSPARRQLPPHVRRRPAPAQPRRLRRRRHHRPLHRHQAHRHAHHRPPSRVALAFLSVIPSGNLLLERPSHPKEHTMKKTIITSVLYTLITAVILGIGYPLLITGIDHVLFPKQADGELITRNGEVIGSHLIGQTFTGDNYFNSRPSAAGTGYDAASSAAPTRLHQQSPHRPRPGQRRRRPRSANDPRPRRPRHRLRLRPRPRHLPRRGLLPGSPRRPRPPSLGVHPHPPHRRPHHPAPVRPPRRTPRQRPRPQPGPRRPLHPLTRRTH